MPTGLLRCKRFLRWPKGGKTMERQSDHRMSFGKQVEPYLNPPDQEETPRDPFFVFWKDDPLTTKGSPRS